MFCICARIKHNICVLCWLKFIVNICPLPSQTYINKSFINFKLDSIKEPQVTPQKFLRNNYLILQHLNLLLDIHAHYVIGSIHFHSWKSVFLCLNDSRLTEEAPLGHPDSYVLMITIMRTPLSMILMKPCKHTFILLTARKLYM